MQIHTRDHMHDAAPIDSVLFVMSSSLARQFRDDYRDSWGEYFQQLLHWTASGHAV